MKNDIGIDKPLVNPASPIPLPCKDAVEMPSSGLQQQGWNTKNLGLRLGADFTSAACAASMVAPLISIIDRNVAS
ncbi:hypothetical protein PC116_g30187 [Phytophthora cactorum]|nr:hypothetical protein PC116_g30187 [Phytophthora cactorum]